MNRAAEALKSFPNTPSNEEALYLMVKGYDALDLPELRDGADRVLRQSFPDSVTARRREGRQAMVEDVVSMAPHHHPARRLDAGH